MKYLKHLIYKIVIFVFTKIPFNNFLAIILKLFGISGHKIYKDLKFSGVFQVNFIHQLKKYHFKMFHNGGYIENETFWRGLFTTFERESGRIWMEFSDISSVIFDVGANTGIYSLVSKTINKGSKIYAFEPSINTNQKFLKNIEHNDFNINCFPIALGENDGEQTFYDFKFKNQTSASLSPEKSKGVKEVWEYKVKTLKLDSFIEEYKISNIDLIKIDVEMYEPQVLKGFSKNINKFLPVIFIEVLTDEIANQIYPIIVQDYEIYQLNVNSTIKKVERFTIVAFVWNYLLIPKVKIENYKGLIDKFEIK
jgi:FkbM family methyltransferase